MFTLSSFFFALCALLWYCFSYLHHPNFFYRKKSWLKRKAKNLELCFPNWGVGMGAGSKYKRKKKIRYLFWPVLQNWYNGSVRSKSPSPIHLLCTNTRLNVTSRQKEITALHSLRVRHWRFTERQEKSIILCIEGTIESFRVSRP